MSWAEWAPYPIDVAILAGRFAYVGPDASRPPRN